VLTNLLVDHLKKSAPSRVVLIGAAGNFKSVDFENLNAEKSFGRFSSLNSTQISNDIYTVELAERLKGTGKRYWKVK
jgi:hypothetical protein